MKEFKKWLKKDCGTCYMNLEDEYCESCALSKFKVWKAALEWAENLFVDRCLSSFEIEELINKELRS